jgi:hypothetical protein
MSMKRLSALLATATLALCFGASQAVAAEGGSGAGQAAGQSALSGQSASGGSGAYQLGPSNSAGSIRVLSPGDSGDVTQSNNATAASVAANANKTDQTLDQTQTGGGYGSSYGQIAGQEAQNTQKADADATAKQYGAKNDALSIRVLSPGDNGDVDQSNSVGAGALAANGNKTDQTTDQSQSGGGIGSDATQIAGQAADNHQKADADATAVQVKPTNSASSIRVLSPGDDGDVTQSNNSTALAAALNGNKTDQSIDQSQGAAPMDAAKSAEAERGTAPSYGSDSTQIAGQAAENKQSADADATAVQVKPTNTASSIRVLSPGDGGDVTQSNNATGLAAALNGNKTDQSIDQSQGGAPKEPAKTEDAKSVYPSGSSYTQIAGQSADNKQSADADATAVQIKPTNTATSIRVLSPGDDGDVTQSNNAIALGIAANGNKTDQSIDQSQGGGSYEPAKEDAKSSHPSGSSYTQIAGQEAGNYQKADADATAVQVKPSNTASSIRVLSPGDDGDVTQSNNAVALGAALNLNDTEQTIDQQQSGSGHGSDYLQVAGQGAWSGQHADADAKAIQLGAKNEYTPVRVLSPNGKKGKKGKKGKHEKEMSKEDGGSVEQSNSVGAFALALNLNKTHQPLRQTQSGRGGSSGLQVGGQGAWSSQYGSADAFGLQGVMRSKK